MPQTQQDVPNLDLMLCDAIDRWRHQHNPDLTILETLTALENVRHLLTEIWLGQRGLK